MIQFLTEHDLAVANQGEIEAALSDGRLEAWRTDAAGTKWFRLRQTIHAIPSADFSASAADDDDGDEDDEDEVDDDADGDETGGDDEN